MTDNEEQMSPPQPDEHVEKIQSALKDITAEVKRWRDRRVEISTNTTDLLKVVELVGQNDLNYKFLVTIIALDTGEHLQVKYVLADKKDVLSISVDVPYDNPHCPTLTGLLPAATLYEREVHDLLGVVFDGHQNLKPLVLADDWPEGVYPLRKDFQFYKDEEGKPVKACLIDQATEIKEDIQQRKDERKAQESQG